MWSMNKFELEIGNIPKIDTAPVLYFAMKKFVSISLSHVL